MENKENKQKIWTIVENIHSESGFNIFTYSSYEKAKENFDRLVEYYKENYDRIFQDCDNYELGNDFLSIWDMVDIEIESDTMDNDLLFN